MISQETYLSAVCLFGVLMLVFCPIACAIYRSEEIRRYWTRRKDDDHLS